ncbi:hypothetical protein RJ639_005528, partial [Escallonia herrerae]
MFSPASLRGNFVPLSQCSSCCDLRFQPVSSTSITSRKTQSNLYISHASSIRLLFRRKREVICRVAETEAEPDGNDDKEKEVHEDGEMPVSSDSSDLIIEKSPQPIVDDQDKEQSIEMLDSNNLTGNSLEVKVPGIDEVPYFVVVLTQDSNSVEVTSGSPLPGVKPRQLDEFVKIPKETVDVLRDQVFGFDTFFVTSQEPYEGGLLFKGNLRGQAAKSYEKITKRMEDRLGDQYKLFILINPEDDKPVAVVVPRKTLQPEITAVPEWFAAGAFGLVTLFTLLLRNVPALQSNLLSTLDNLDLLKDGLPGALVTALVLGVHEISHILVARNAGVK